MRLMLVEDELSRDFIVVVSISWNESASCFGNMAGALVYLYLRNVVIIFS